MAEFPNPVRTLQHIGWVVFAKAEGAALKAIVWFRERVEDEYRKPGPRDG